MAESYETIELRQADGVAHLTLNRPHKKNAVNATMWDELLAAFRSLSADPGLRVLVVRGAGGSFCSGADLSDRREAVHPLASMRHVHSVAEALVDLSVPTIACVDGDAVGAGCNLALACDIVLASTRSRFSEIFVRRGLSPDFGGSWLVPRLVGLQRAKLLCLTGDIIDATTAAEMGLIAGVHPADELEAAVADLVAKLAAGPPLALALTKQLLNDSSTSTFAEALAAEGAAQAVNLSADDAREARTAFVEKRPAVFRGR